MITNNITFRILVKGKPITEYFHRGQTFVEGRAGSNYEIEFSNTNPFRVEAIISVDGLSVLDGKEAGENSRGYVVDAGSTLRVPGWKVDNAVAASFEFSGKKESYATGATGSSRNNGVIGVMAYREKSAPYVPLIPKNSRDDDYPFNTERYYKSKSYPSVSLSITDDSFVSGANICRSKSYGGGSLHSAISFSPEPVQQSLGTAFGEATEFRTTSVSFSRGDLLGVLVLYYDERRGLTARGIDVSRSAQKFSEQPQAFPAQTGCAVPPNWSGQYRRKTKTNI